MEVNDPPPRPPDYVRPPIWRRSVVPLPVIYAVQLPVTGIALAILLLLGLDLGHAALFSVWPGLLAGSLMERWWRRNRPPSADRRPSPSKDPDDYV